MQRVITECNGAIWGIRSIGVNSGNWRGLLGTGQAAKAIGIDRGTLRRWWREGRVTPEWVTAGGQARWDVAKLKRQLGITPRDDA